jgi:predicted DNA-binding transcriptional regulator YafY
MYFYQYGANLWHHNLMARSLDDEIHGLLATGEHYTAALLAERLSVSLRTIRRVIARLREDGVHIESDVGRGGGIRLSRRSGLPKLRLHQTEVISLLMALALAESLELPLLGQQLSQLRNKLCLAFDSQERPAISKLRQRILVGNVASGKIQESWRKSKQIDIDLLQSAFFSRNMARFRYTDSAGVSTHRLVEPQYLILTHPAWYLLAFDTEKRNGRTFRIDRINEVEIVDDSIQLSTRRLDSLFTDAKQWFAPI